ncbi:SCO1664 family protein [Angustibacter sp. Root456]|uniref:SCO1664 family protein n=1 Tax=Angustibacter sp. Root456 TaxID=1736539 RepID=UPI0006F7998E|nr:SCO1664 family protein [Angustibacter sp. Root456]KQX66550.1 phosphatidylinositol kinase [Angustibacter sp. Root456]
MLPEKDALELLTRGEIVVEGRMTAASNATLYASVTAPGASAHCIYKPVAGERPLRDFPHQTLSRREVAAYLVSRATGWDVVPPTVWREEAPFGPGSVQLWIDADDTELVDVVPMGGVQPGWLPVLQAMDGDGSDVLLVHADDPRLARMAVFDAVIDNADRKGGHVLVHDDHVWGVDHGLSFNLDDKLRSVLWGWQGSELPADCLDVLQALATDLRPHGSLARSVSELITVAEVARTRERVLELISTQRFPRPTGYGPVIPWPPF